MQDLLIIRDFILQRIESFFQTNAEKDDPRKLLTDLAGFLDRLINEKEADLPKDPWQIKAGRQLLCSIGIDLLNNAVPIEKYVAIFKEIDYSNFDKQASILFSDCLLNNADLIYRETDKKSTQDFKVILCPINDISHYIDLADLGIFQFEQKKFQHGKLLAAGPDVYLTKPRLDKRHHYRHFWITTQHELDRIMALKNTTNHIVDQLGLSHFDFNNEAYQYFFYINLGNLLFETFKPNATIVNWSNPKVGYVSYEDSTIGKTFSITGYITQDVGMAERVFHILEIEKDQLSSTTIVPIKDAVVPPIEIECNDIIQEAIKRFRVKYTYA